MKLTKEPTRSVPLDLNEAVKKFEGKPTTDEGRACRDFIEMADAWADIVPTASGDEETWLSIDEASTLLGVHAQTLRNWEKQGKVHPVRTKAGGHRRYQEKEILNLRKQQIGNTEIILPDVLPGKLLELAHNLLSSFDPEGPIQITISTDNLERTVRITADSDDGLTTVSKTFKMED